MFSIEGKAEEPDLELRPQDEGRGRGREVTIHELPTQLQADRFGVGVPAGAVHRDEQTNVLVQHQKELAVETVEVPVMFEHAVAVAIRFEESQRHAVEVGHGSKCRGVHLFGRCRRENLLSAEATLVQMGDHEAGDVPAAGAQGSRRRDVFQLEITRGP